jgi:hypothetical protein
MNEVQMDRMVEVAREAPPLDCAEPGLRHGREGSNSWPLTVHMCRPSWLMVRKSNVRTCLALSGFSGSINVS